MSDLTGETWGEPIQTTVTRYEATIEQSLDPIAQGRLANQFRDNFLAGGAPTDYTAAMLHYGSAIEKAAGDPASEVWLRCHRLNLSLALLQDGQMHVADFEDELVSALTAAKKLSYLEDPRFTLRTRRWLTTRLHELYEPAEQAHEDILVLGGLALATEVIEAEPGAKIPVLAPA